MKKYLSLLTSALALMSSPALAEPYVYGPDHCEFKITFPEKPYIEEKCGGVDKKECVEVVSYAKVVSAETSVNFRLTCQKLDDKEIARYTLPVMEETLKGLLTQANISNEGIESADENGFKSVAAANVGRRGDRDILYTGQIWIGKTSMFTLEGDVSGPGDDKADRLFSDILKSMEPKNAPAKKAAPKKDEPAAKTQP